MNEHPRSSEAWFAYANSLSISGEREKAVDAYQKAIEFDRENFSAKINLALTYLEIRNYREGFARYRSRWSVATMSKRDALPNVPELTLESFPSARKIYVYSEQGYGSCIQFGRFLAALPAHIKKLCIQTPPPLSKLFQSAFPQAIVKTEPPVGEDEFDGQCGLMDLPYLLQMFEPIHWPSETYIAQELSGEGDGKVAVVWRGSNSPNQASRSIPIEEFSSIFDSGREFICLQKELLGAEERILRKYKNVTNLSEELSDFSSTARIISGVSTVVSVDTSVAHLAASMGKPTIVLLPRLHDFSWVRAQDWYPKVKTLVQKQPGRWRDTLVQLADILRRAPRHSN